MKSQVSVEYLIIISVAIMILIPIILYANELLLGYKDDTKISLARNAVEKIGENVDWVYSQGAPAKRSLEVYIPEGIEQINLENKTILFKIKTRAGTSDIFYTTVANLSGSIPMQSSYYKLSLTAHQNFVNISW